MMHGGPANLAIEVVIVNFKVGPLAVRALESLAPQRSDGATLHVSVVDNASNDGSAELLLRTVEERNWRSWVTVLPQEKNHGFAGGNNAAVGPALSRAVPPDVFFFLNPDAYAQPGCVAAIVEFLHARPDVRLAGVRVLGHEGEVRASAFRFHSVMSEFLANANVSLFDRVFEKHLVRTPLGDELQTVDWVSGAGMVARREVFERVGLMDDGFFLYFEETEFCLRAKAAGFQCYYYPGAQVVHEGGQSTGMTGKALAQEGPKRRPGYWFESRRRYFTKRGGVAYAGLADAANLAGLAVSRAVEAVSGRSSPHPPQLARDILKHSPLTAPLRAVRARA